MNKKILVFVLVCGLSFAEKDDGGILDEIIKGVLESIRPTLAKLKINYQEFKSGPQEFGNLEGHIKEVEIKDLDKFAITRLDTILFDVNNLTMTFKEFSSTGFYDLNGTLAFPLGKNDIHFYGKGKMNVTFINFMMSMAIKMETSDGQLKVKKLLFFVNLGGFQVHFQNLMGGGELENVFNFMMNEVGLTVFNYYKDSVIENITPLIIEKINELLSSNKTVINEQKLKTELR